MPPIDAEELLRHRRMHAIHAWRLAHDAEYAAAEKDRQKRDRARRKQLQERLQQALAIAPAVGDRVQIHMPGNRHDGAIGTVVSLKIDHPLAQVLCTVDLKPKARTTALPAWARRQRGVNAKPHGVVALSPLIVRLVASPSQLRPAQLASLDPAALVSSIAPHECDPTPQTDSALF